MPNDFYGLPLHPLIVHATVVIIPLAALTVGLYAVWPRFRVWSGPLPTVLSLIGAILVPLSTSTGETLERHVKETTLLEKHTEMADALLPWMIAMLVLSALGYALQRRSAQGRDARKFLTTGIAVLAVAAAIGTTVQVGRIGHSGAKSAWEDTNMNSTSRQ